MAQQPPPPGMPGQYGQPVFNAQAMPPPPPGYVSPHAPANYGGQQQWMAAPQRPANCPPGLEYLLQVDQLLVHQQVELLEAFTGYESNNKYGIKNAMGQQVYFAAEDNDCCTRMCCGPNRPFDMKILDNMQQEVMHLVRPLRCSSCWFPCCLQKLEVYSPPGTLIGTVSQSWSICGPAYDIKNASDQTVLKIEGPCCTWSICGDVEFKVMSSDGASQIGKISKQWTGFVKEHFTDADNFGVQFPMDLDVNVKATMLAATFLIDFMFFESTGNQNTDGPGMAL